MPEQFVEAAKSQINSHLTLIDALTRKTFAQVEKIISLNIATTKVALQESNTTFQKLLSATSPQEFFSVTNAQVKPSIEKFRSYGEDLIAPTVELAAVPVQNIAQAIVSSAEVTPSKKHPPAFVAAKQEAIQFVTPPTEKSIPTAQPAILATPPVDETDKPRATVNPVIEKPTAKPAAEVKVAAIVGIKPAKIDINPAVIPNAKVNKPVTNKIASKPPVEAAPVKPAVAGNQVWQAPKIKHPTKK